MQNIKQRIITENFIESTTCDCCKTEYKINNPDYQEMLFINYIGGYNSIFGDTNHITLDLCQFCVKERLGDILNVSENEEKRSGYI